MSEPSNDFLQGKFRKMTDVPDDSPPGCGPHSHMQGTGSLRLRAGLFAVLLLFVFLAVAAVVATLCWWYSSLSAQTVTRVALILGVFGALVFAVALVLALWRARPRFSIRSLVLVNGLSALGFACLPWQLASSLTVGLGLVLVFMPLSVAEVITVLAISFVIGNLLTPAVTPNHGRRRVRPATPPPVLSRGPVPALTPTRPPAN